MKQLVNLFTGSHITDEGARLLAEALDPERMMALSLWNNQFTSEGETLLRERFGVRAQL